MALRTFLVLIALAAPAAAEDPCTEARELGEQILALQEQIAFLIEDARPVCAEKALAKECARRRIEIDGFIRSAAELNVQRKKAKAACEKKP